MNFSTPLNWPVYLAINTRLLKYAGEEVMGLALGRFYIGYYGYKTDPAFPNAPKGWCAGMLDDNGCL